MLHNDTALQSVLWRVRQETLCASKVAVELRACLHNAQGFGRLNACGFRVCRAACSCGNGTLHMSPQSPVT